MTKTKREELFRTILLSALLGLMFIAMTYAVSAFFKPVAMPYFFVSGD